MHTGDANGVEKNGKLPEASRTTVEKDAEIKKLLISHKSDNPSLDLCNKRLLSLPSELFVLAHLQVICKL